MSPDIIEKTKILEIKCMYKLINYLDLSISEARQFNKQNVSVSNILVCWQLPVFMVTTLTPPANQREAWAETDQWEDWDQPPLVAGIKTSIWYRARILISPHLHMLEPSGGFKLKYFGFKLRIKFYICSGFILPGRVSDINDGIYQLSKNESPSLQRI